MRFLLLVFVLAASAVSAQPEWRPAPSGPSVSVDALLAIGDDLGVVVTDADGNLVGDGTVDAVSSVLLLSGRVPVGSRWTVLAEVPLAYAGFSGPLNVDETFDESDAAFGNPYVGVEARLRPALAAGVGVRLPLFNDVTDAESFGWQGGMGADIERFEAYVPDVFTVSAMAEFVPTLSPSARLRLRLAPAVVTDVSGAENVSGRDATGLLLGYSAQAEVDVRAVTLRGGLVGRPNVTGDRFEVFETTATLVAGATVEVAGVRPGLLVRVPLDGDRLYLAPDATVGFSLDVPIR